jgi:uncharacterized membrane protein
MATAMETRTNTADMDIPLGTALKPDVRPRPTRTVPYQQLANTDRGTGGHKLADFLGVFSIGLGLAEVAMPGVMSRIVGVDPRSEKSRQTMRALGMREIGHGVAILSNPHPTKEVWSRVAGDAIDLSLLSKAMSNPNNQRGRTLFATANVLAVTALDVMCARELSSQPDTPLRQEAERGILHTREGITVMRPVQEVYAFWRNFENFPQFMRHLESVTVTDERRSHWVAKAPAGMSVEWDAEIIAERENETIAWRSLPGSQVFNAGTVTFMPAPRGRGTEVRVDLSYRPPLGKLASKVAMLWREEPKQQVQDDLRHFKQVMEVGEIVLSDATKQRGPHPARPDDKPVEL